jgi:hypothetical protein
MKNKLPLIIIILIISSITLGCNEKTQIASPGDKVEQSGTQQQSEEQQNEEQQNEEQQPDTDKQPDIDPVSDKDEIEGDKPQIGQKQEMDLSQDQSEKKDGMTASILDDIEAAITEKLNKEGQKFIH